MTVKTKIDRVLGIVRESDEGIFDGFKKFTIKKDDWVLLDGLYYITINHNLNSKFPQVQISEQDQQVFVHETESVDNNNIRLWVTSDPDLRFDGEVSVIIT